MSVHEIAKRAGVSITTVSRVLNNNPNVRPETALQVRKVLEQFPYDRNAVRRGPRPGKRVRRTAAKLRHGVISIVVLGLPSEQWFKQPIFASAVASITRCAAEQNLSIRIEEVLDVAHISSSISADVVDGALVFVHSLTPPRLLEALKARLPIVRVMGDDLVSSSIDQVRPDNLAIGHMAYDYLAQHGCQRLACVTTRPFHGGILLRTLGFAAAANAGGAGPPALFSAGARPYGPWFGVKSEDCESLEAIGTAIVNLPTLPDGIFVTQDIEAIVLCSLFARTGIRVGQDVHVISCNNDDSMALLSPRPSSIDLNTDAIGRWSLRRLLNRINRPDEPPIQMLVKPLLRSPS